MRKTMHVAMREFGSTVMTKGFIFGILLTPLILLVVVGAIYLMKYLPKPSLVGEVAIVDRTGLVAPRVQDAFTEAAIKEEQEREQRGRGELGAEMADKIGLDEAQQESMKAVAAATAAPAPDLTVVVLDGGTDTEPLKNDLKSVDIAAQDEAGKPKRQRVAVAVIDDAALKRGEGGAFGGYELYTAQRIDFEIQERITDRIARAIVDTRLAQDPAISSTGLTNDQLRSLLRAPKVSAQTMTSRGERKSSQITAMLLPLGFMLLLFIAVMTGGQYLVTTVVEEKSSRVMEVLLSAVSPMELMVGKIVGQMCVALLILAVYSGMSIAGLLAFSQQHMLQPINIIYIVIFFFIAFFVVASLLAAVGSAVTELREAQTLMTPIMVSLMLPYLLWLPVSRAPNSLFSTILSFIPVINPFVMVIRLGGSEPIPAWQPPVGVLVGIVTVIICAWAAAKVFRIGVLMYGKPPNLKTLIQWVRMA